MADTSRRTVLWLTASLSAAAAASAYAYQAWQQHRKRKMGNLNTYVGFSAKAIAAIRAMEMRKGSEALVVDPMAELLAGEAAMKRMEAMYAKRQAAESTSSQQPNGTATDTTNATTSTSTNTNTTAGTTAAAADKATNGKKRPTVQRIIMRHLVFDDGILYTTGGTPRCLTKGLKATGKAAKNARCTQVVQLGAGMDTRAWRLNLPAGVKWFEVDTADVLAAKRRDMSALGASFEVTTECGMVSVGAGDAQAQPTFPLKSASYADVVADLQVRGWSAALMAAGFHASEPTVWILEGLLYYLAQDTVPGLFQEMADISAPGSVMVASAVSRTVTDRMRRGGGDITSKWQWGAPGTVDEWPAYWAASGWVTTSIDHWLDSAEEYGLEPIQPTSYQTSNSKGGKGGKEGEQDSVPANKQGGIVFAVRA